MPYILHCERVAGGTRSPATLLRLPSMISQGSVEEMFSLQASLDFTPDCVSPSHRCTTMDKFSAVCLIVCSVTMLRFHKKIWDLQVDWLWQFEQLRAEGVSVPRMHAELEAFCCHHISALLELMEGWDGEVSFESTHVSALTKL
ncbi:unnamed protein product [Sphagnum balticum]